jgi:hypothetical protein
MSRAQDEYVCQLCGAKFDEDQIITGPRPFETLSPCCKSEDFDLTPACRQAYRDMLKPIPPVAMPVSTTNLESLARRAIQRMTEDAT